jgi:hypothetical protein
MYRALTLNVSNNSVWAFADDVTILVVTTSDGSVDIDLSDVWINQANDNMCI